MEDCLQTEGKVKFCGDGNEVDLCIVCYSKVNVPNIGNNGPLLSSNLNVIFLLRNLFQVPYSQLEESLKECGDPVNWISLCDGCKALTRKAEELHWNIVKTKGQLRSVQQLLLDKVLKASTPPSLPLKNTVKRERKGKEIWRKTRDCISNYNQREPNLINPFIEGDKRAKYLQTLLAEKKQSSFEDDYGQDDHVIKVEMEEDDEYAQDYSCDLGDGEDFEWEPPPEDLDKVKQDPDTTTVGTTTPEIKKRSTSSSKRYKKPKRRKLKTANGRPKRHNCHLCNYGFEKQSQLNLHLFRRHKDDPATMKLVDNGYQLFKCKVLRCQAFFAKQTSLDEHMVKCHNRNPNGGTLKSSASAAYQRFSCKFCKRDMRSKASLIFHEGLHVTKDQLFQCDLCDDKTKIQRIFRTSLYLAQHKRRVHGIVEKDTKISNEISETEESICYHCGKKCKSSHSLKKHLVAMHKEDPLVQQLMEEGYGVWRCKVPGCSYKYSHKWRLDEHVEKAHGGNDGKEKMPELSHFCQFCGKGYYVEEALKRHEKTVHEDTEKKFKCQFCGFAVTSQIYLDGHILRVHKPRKDGEVKGDKVFICDICGIQFWENEKLDKHKIIHDKNAEQPHPCDVCGRAYSTHESMWKHKRKIHKIYRRPDDSRIKREPK